MPETFSAAETLLQAGVLPMAPGQYFGRYVLQRQGDTPSKAAVSMGVDDSVVIALIADEIPIDTPMAARLGKYADTTPDFWLKMQESWNYAKNKVKAEDRAKYLQVDPYTYDPDVHSFKPTI